MVTQHGSNGFLLGQRFAALFIAGGVGITPFRSMIKAVLDSGDDVDMTLVYQNHTDDFPFKQEMDALAVGFPCFRVHYVATGTEDRLTTGKLRMLLSNIPAARPMSYVAGSPGMVDSLEDMLVALDIGKDAIKTDRFTGYA